MSQERETVRNPERIRFRDQVVIVTGAGSGTGQALAQGFAQEGAIVILVGRTKSKLLDTGEQIKDAGGKAEVQVCDVSQKKQVEEVVRSVFEKFRRIDVLVNCAGVQSSFSPTEDLKEEDWRRVLGINLDGYLYFSQAVAPHMKAQGKGKIVNISSIHAFATYPLRTDYAVSKAAIVGLTRSLAVDWGKYGIRVNCVAPGQIKTEMAQKAIDAGKLDVKAIEQRTPLGRIAEPEDIVGPVLFFASDESRHITGQTLAVDGGYLINAAP